MNHKDLLREIREAIVEIEVHRAEAGGPREGYPHESDLDVIRDELRRIESEIVQEKVPSRAQRSTWIGRIIVDGWWKCDKEPFAQKLLAIADGYKRRL